MEGITSTQEQLLQLEASVDRLEARNADLSHMVDQLKAKVAERHTRRTA